MGGGSASRDEGDPSPDPPGGISFARVAGGGYASGWNAPLPSGEDGCLDALGSPPAPAPMGAWSRGGSSGGAWGAPVPAVPEGEGAGPSRGKKGKKGKALLFSTGVGQRRY
mmetsp:Transcript_39054/g.124344  ORF Transcript_39054/g.124344 Transcript_39054/m.124344 type:complete len:111 (+) Transcript_39054:74-406(+)